MFTRTPVLPICIVVAFVGPILKIPAVPVSKVGVLTVDAFTIDIFTLTSDLPIFMDVAFVVPILKIPAISLSNDVTVIFCVDKLSTETLNIEALFIVTLLTDILVVDKLAMDALFMTAETDTFNDVIIFTPSTILDCEAKLFIAVVTYAVVAAFVELLLGSRVGAVNPIVKLLIPVHVLVEPSKFVPAFNDV